MKYIKAVKHEILRKKDHVTVVLLGRKIGIFKRGEDIYAIETSCKHQGADITKGSRNGDIFTCPRHGWKYNIYTGECVSHKSPNLKKLPVKIEKDYIMVSLAPQEF